LIKSTDILWLNKSFRELYKNFEAINNKFNNQDEDEDEFIEEIRKEPDETVDAEEKSPEPKILYEMKKLQGWFNPEASRIDELLKSRSKMILDRADIAVRMIESPMEPASFDEAYNHSDLDSRTKWESAIDKQFNKMNVHRFWKKINKSEMPNNLQCVKSKSVFKIKRNCVFQGRLVTCGYSQVPGLDFNNIFAPVVNDVTFASFWLPCWCGILRPRMLMLKLRFCVGT
jgi:hypothetical protein